MTRLSLLALLALIVTGTARLDAAPSILVTDMAGTPVSRLPFMSRGDARLVPLAVLSKHAGFESEIVRDKEHVFSPGCVTILELRNSFAEVNGAFVQMPGPAESWDGSIWLPLESLDQLFPTSLELSDSREVIRLLGVADSSGVVRLVDRERKSNSPPVDLGESHSRSWPWRKGPRRQGQPGAN
ncbi:MAG: hypothetical protein IPG71_12940 [bacterium]|nr:hypothetical protein [bacterium]